MNYFFYLDSKRKVHAINDNICELRERMCSISINYDTRVKSSNFDSKLDKYVIRLEQFENDLIKAKKESIAALEYILLLSDKALDDPEEKVVFTMKYIKGYKWDDIARELELSERHCRRLASAARAKIEQYLSCIGN